MSLFSKKQTAETDAPELRGAAPSAEAEVVTEAQIDEVMKKYDRESNTRIWTGVPHTVVSGIMSLFSLYCIWSTLTSKAALEVRLTAFLGCVVVMGFLYYPASKHHVRPNYMPWYDWVIMLVGAACFFYYCFNYDAISVQMTSFTRMTDLQLAVGIIGILVVLELCRRCVGLPILFVLGALLIYTFAIGTPIKRLVYKLFFSTDGVIGTPAQVCAKFIVVFIVFGSFLERTGISKFFIDLANKLAGWSSGGPAKVAVISSALCGMVSGSSVGNTVTTGSVTIPMMKKTGYKPEFAGAVEAAASTGGQIMPPIMGAAAFLMVEYVTMPDVTVTYGYIALRAILPAVLYFAGIFIMVHLEAKKNSLTGIPREKLPKFWPLFLRNGFLLLPLVALVYFLMTRTMAFAAIAATGLAVLVSMVHRETRIVRIVFHEDVGYRIDFSRFLDALEAGAKSTLTVGVACAVAGIIACVITTTGIGSSLISIIIGASGGYRIVALFLTMLTCIVLGMGVPTTANYVIMATTCAPVLIRMGIPSIAAHMFVFYFGIVADITPPVALAAYAGSAIAHASPMKTGINATKLAIAAFIIPYILALNPAMVFVDTTVVEVVSIVITSLAGMFGLSMALEGYYHGDLPAPLRAVSAVGGLLLIYPGLATDAVGLLLVGGIIAFQILREKRTAAV